MKKPLTILAALICGVVLHSQAQIGCMPSISKGDKIHSIAHNYYQDFDMDETGKMVKMKLEKREKAVEAFNADILSGKIKPKSWPMYTEITNVYDTDGTRAIEMSYDMNKRMVSNFYICSNDTMYITRMDGIMFLEDAKKDTVGVSVFGVSKIPLNLKVGDALPVYTDYTWNFPIGYETTGVITVFDGYKRTSGVAHGTFTDSRTGKTENGFYSYEGKVAQYVDKEVPGYMNMETKNVTIYNAYSAVTRTEEVDVNGKKYTALVIESENWSKMTADFKFYSHYQEAVDRFEKGKAYLDKQYSKKFEKFGLVNEYGYTPSYITQYFVPEIGVVRTINYDPFGRIMGIIDVIDIVKK